MADSIDMLLGMTGHMDPRNNVLVGGTDLPSTRREKFGGNGRRNMDFLIHPINYLID